MTAEDSRTSTERNVSPGEGYGGDVTPEQAWKILEEESDAVLVDCRTQPEWIFVGVPDLSPLRKKAALVPWQVFPTMQVNPEFVRQVKDAGAKEDAPVLFICRSGNRSRAAAIALTEKGFRRAYNIAGGFEGSHDGARHRGMREGWKVSGLPWIQD
ncbi:MAG TPA: rhodanese-like domain-containing protein [Alphaproteobacteria bacterium]|jgi:rhodanese-related sulfurtransferase